MPVATITSKGQITIPKAIREHLGVTSGHRLEFRIGDDGAVTVLPINRSAASSAGAFAHKARGKPVSDEDMRRAIGESVSERNQRKP